MKYTLFLGAGASMPLKFPDTRSFKEDLESSLGQNPNGKKMLSMLQRSGYEDIEGVLTAINALVSLHSNKGYDLLNKTVTLTYTDRESDPNTKSFDDIVVDFHKHKEDIQKQVYTAYSWRNGITNEDLKVYDPIFRILNYSNDGIHICTTNYDQTMEKYIDREDNELTRVDGFRLDSNTRKHIFQPDIFDNPPQDDPHAKNCYLYKLHGSLNWISDGDKTRQRETDESFANGGNLVIYPTLSSKEEDYKLEPYATMLAKFRKRIEETDVFIVVGYSFRDDIINEEFKKFLRRDKTKMFVISPNADTDSSGGLGNEEFTHASLNLTDPSQQEKIHEYSTAATHCNFNSSGDLKELERVLCDCFPDLWTVDAKVYNLIGKLEDANGSNLVDAIPLICEISEYTAFLENPVE